MVMCKAAPAATPGDERASSPTTILSRPEELKAFPPRFHYRKGEPMPKSNSSVSLMMMGLLGIALAILVGWMRWSEQSSFLHELSPLTALKAITSTSPFAYSDEGPLETESHQYAIVIDAGSTGSRLFVYRFFYRQRGGKREIECVTSKKATPGLSTFEKEPERVKGYLQPLFTHAASVIPAEFHSETLIYLQATAGMRLIPEDTQELIYDTIYNNLGQDPTFPFKLIRSNIATLSGRLEGFYAALSANYLTGRINTHLEPHEKHKEAIIGALDMGGSSTQIVFQHVEDNRMELDESDFWVQSYLAYGVDTIRYRLWNHLVRDAPVDETVDLENPCTFIGHIEHFKGYRLVGTGHAGRCAVEIRRMLWEDAHETCSEEEPCGLDGIRHPPLSGQFLAMSVFFFALDCMRLLGPVDLPNWPSPSVNEIEAAAEKFCGQDWMAVNTSSGTHHFTSDNLLAYRCVEVVYIYTLLKHGYGFPGDSRNITFVLNIDNNEVEWTLGFALSEVPIFKPSFSLFPALLPSSEVLSEHAPQLFLVTVVVVFTAAVASITSRRWSKGSSKTLSSSTSQ